jgi:hypothetical protein
MASLGLKPSDLKKEREVSYARAQPLIDEAPPVAKAAVAAKPVKKAPAKPAKKAAAPPAKKAAAKPAKKAA